MKATELRAPVDLDEPFFVKLGDGAADVKPIAHLYKMQVYQMAEFLQLPESIRNRPPTTRQPVGSESRSRNGVRRNRRDGLGRRHLQPTGSLSFRETLQAVPADRRAGRRQHLRTDPGSGIGVRYCRARR